jgi:hypothetical protein
MTAGRFARIPARAGSMRELSGGDLRVLITIGAHADGEGRAYPSMTTIAGITGLRREDVPRAVRRLEHAGLLRRESRVGLSAGNIYTVMFGAPEVSAMSRTEGVRNDADSVSADLRTEVSAMSRTGCPQIDTSGVRSIAYQTNKNRPINKNTALKRAKRQVVSTVADAQFEEFWRSYPSRGGQANPRKPALEKFTAAVKRGVDPELMIRGAGNYAEAMRRSGTAGQYIKTAEVWLNKASWEQYGDLVDDPEPLRAGLI